MAKRIKLKDKQAVENETSCNSSDYQKGLDLAESGKLSEALVCFEKYLVSSPQNAEILNDIGAILHCMHRSEEAIKYFLRAKELQPQSAEILWNLSETYLAEGQAKKATELFDDMQKIGILNAEVLNRASEKLINAGDLDYAVKTLNKSLEISPNQPMLPKMIEIINHKIEINSKSTD